jgi:hypothetical protein
MRGTVELAPCLGVPAHRRMGPDATAGQLGG